jgi:uroporphyrinogen-III synthase
LPDRVIRQAAEGNIHIEVLSFIETRKRSDPELTKIIEGMKKKLLQVIFTSVNAVQAVIDELNGERPDWIIYCTGQTTRGIVEDYFGPESIAGTASSSEELAESILQKAPFNSFVFFCGDQRREELPGILKESGYSLEVLVVYETLETPHKSNKHYDAILFYSPSAVESFFSMNNPEPGTILFAIGKTTAGEIAKHANNPILIAEKPVKKLLAEQAIRYFQTI